jgi:long-chain acyl-CoA synthetase
MTGNACGDVFGWAARDPGRAIFAVRSGGAWQPVTAQESAGRVTSVAAGLVAAGIRPGDRVALLASTSLEWAVCDFAIWAAGAVTVPVYGTASVQQIGWELGGASASAPS